MKKQPRPAFKFVQILRGDDKLKMGVCTSDCGEASIPPPPGYGIWNPTLPPTAFTGAYNQGFPASGPGGAYIQQPGFQMSTSTTYV